MEKIGRHSCLLLDRTQVSGDSLMFGWMLLCFGLQGHRRPESCDTDGLITCSVLKWENKDLMLQQFDGWGPLSLHIPWCCQLWSSFTSCRHEHNNNSRLHFNSNTRLQQASGSSDWLTVPPLSLSVQSWSLSPFSSHSFTEESRKYWIFTLILTVFITILLKPARTDSNSLLTSESPVDSLDYLQMKQQLHSWILQVIVSQVQLSQMGGVGLQSWGHDFTVTLWESTINKSVMTDNRTLKQ